MISVSYSVTRQSYKVTITHPTGFHTGTHTFTVRTATEPGKIIKSVDGAGFGCGRDQLAQADALPWVKLTDTDAIKNFLAEHACTVVKINKIKS